MAQQQRIVARILGAVALAVTVAVAGVGSASAAPGPVPAPVRQFAAEHRTSLTGSRHEALSPGIQTGGHRRLAVAEVSGDDQPVLDVYPSCAKGNGKAKTNAAVFSPAKLTLDFRLIGPGVDKSGVTKIKKNRRNTLKLPTVKPGHYRLVVTTHGTGAPVGDESFDVLPCVGVKTSCHAITFTNPAGNPAAVVDYGPKKHRDAFSLQLAPGASRTVRSDDAKVWFDAYAAVDDIDLGAGTTKVKVKKCHADPAVPGSNAVQTIGFASCATGSKAEVALTWSVQSSLKKRQWQILAGQTVVASGSFKAWKDATVSLAPGSYTYRTFANGLTAPFEDVTFRVLACAEVVPECRAFDVHNPNPVPLTVYAFNLDGEIDLDADPGLVETTVPATSTTTVPWSTSEAYVFAFSETSDPTSTFFSSALPDADEEEDPGTPIPQDC